MSSIDQNEDGLLHHEGGPSFRTLDDGRILSVVPLTFGRARLLVSRNWFCWDHAY